MGIISKVQNSNNGQKFIFSAWLIFSFLWGRSWALSEYDEAMIIIYVPIAMIVLAIPALVLYKIWGSSKKENPTVNPTEKGTVFCTSCGSKIAVHSKFCEHCGAKQE